MSTNMKSLELRKRWKDDIDLNTKVREILDWQVGKEFFSAGSEAERKLIQLHLLREISDQLYMIRESLQTQHPL